MFPGSFGSFQIICESKRAWGQITFWIKRNLKNVFLYNCSIKILTANSISNQLTEKSMIVCYLTYPLYNPRSFLVLCDTWLTYWLFPSSHFNGLESIKSLNQFYYAAYIWFMISFRNFNSKLLTLKISKTCFCKELNNFKCSKDGGCRSWPHMLFKPHR